MSDAALRVGTNVSAVSALQVLLQLPKHVMTGGLMGTLLNWLHCGSLRFSFCRTETTATHSGMVGESCLDDKGLLQRAMFLLSRSVTMID